MSYSHALYGLAVSLPFPCPLLPRIESASAPDVTVTYGPVPKELVDAAASDETWKMGYCWQATPGRYLLRGGMRAARFLVEGGNRITLHRNAGAEEERLLFHLLHSVSAALLRQRGSLVLHACTAKTSSGAIVLCGSSGAGKSTTLAAMLLDGCEMLSDDITVLRFAGNGGVEVAPGPARMHLWDDAAKRVGLDLPELGRHPLRRGKAVIPAPGGYSTEPAPLRRICIMEPDTGKKVRCVKLKGTEKLDALMHCVYGPLLPEEHPGLFKLFSATAEQVEILRIHRPEGRWTVDEIVRTVLHE